MTQSLSELVSIFNTLDTGTKRSDFLNKIISDGTVFALQDSGEVVDLSIDQKGFFIKLGTDNRASTVGGKQVGKFSIRAHLPFHMFEQGTLDALEHQNISKEQILELKSRIYKTKDDEQYKAVLQEQHAYAGLREYSSYELIQGITDGNYIPVDMVREYFCAKHDVQKYIRIIKEVLSHFCLSSVFVDTAKVRIDSYDATTQHTKYELEKLIASLFHPDCFAFLQNHEGAALVRGQLGEQFGGDEMIGIILDDQVLEYKWAGATLLQTYQKKGESISPYTQNFQSIPIVPREDYFSLCKFYTETAILAGYLVESKQEDDIIPIIRNSYPETFTKLFDSSFKTTDTVIKTHVAELVKSEMHALCTKSPTQILEVKLATPIRKDVVFNNDFLSLYESIAKPEHLIHAISPQTREVCTSGYQTQVIEISRGSLDDSVQAISSITIQKSINALRLPYAPVLQIIGGAMGASYDESFVETIINHIKDKHVLVLYAGTQSGVGQSVSGHVVSLVQPTCVFASVIPGSEVFYPDNQRFNAHAHITFVLAPSRAVALPISAGWGNNNLSKSFSWLIEFTVGLAHTLAANHAYTTIVINGGPYTIKESIAALENHAELIIMKGSGRFADIAAYIYTEIGSLINLTPESQLEELRRLFGEQYPKDFQRTAFTELLVLFVSKLDEHFNQVTIISLEELDAKLHTLYAE